MQPIINMTGDKDCCLRFSLLYSVGTAYAKGGNSASLHTHLVDM